MLGRQDLFVWEESDELVAMGGFGREIPNGLVINMIYTPRNRRGRGFGGALTTGLVREASGRGKEFCCLYSEFSNSVRKNLYERIGFRLAGKFSERAFDDQSDSVPSDLQ
ncbi:MAG: GNAT family N-acetyltransferase [Opitutales bacterium]